MQTHLSFFLSRALSLAPARAAPSTPGPLPLLLSRWLSLFLTLSSHSLSLKHTPLWTPYYQNLEILRATTLCVRANAHARASERACVDVRKSASQQFQIIPVFPPLIFLFPDPSTFLSCGTMYPVHLRRPTLTLTRDKHTRTHTYTRTHTCKGPG